VQIFTAIITKLNRALCSAQAASHNLISSMNNPLLQLTHLQQIPVIVAAMRQQKKQLLL
jgi:hypothetical protein